MLGPPTLAPLFAPLSQMLVISTRRHHHNLSICSLLAITDWRKSCPVSLRDVSFEVFIVACSRYLAAYESLI